MADGTQRTDYVTVSNSVIGVLLLVFGAVGGLVPFISISGVIMMLAIFGLAGAVVCRTLPETRDTMKRDSRHG